MPATLRACRSDPNDAVDGAHSAASKCHRVVASKRTRSGLIDLDFDVELTGFSPAEIDLVLDEAREGSPNTPTEAEDQVSFPIDDQASAVTRAGRTRRHGAYLRGCG